MDRNGLAGRKLSCPNTDGSLWGEFADASYCLPAAPESDPASTRGAFRTCHRAWERYQGQALYDILRCRNCGGFSQSVAVDCDLRAHHGNLAGPRSADRENAAGGLTCVEKVLKGDRKSTPLCRMCPTLTGTWTRRTFTRNTRRAV